MAVLLSAFWIVPEMSGLLDEGSSDCYPAHIEIYILPAKSGQFTCKFSPLVPANAQWILMN